MCSPMRPNPGADSALAQQLHICEYVTLDQVQPGTVFWGEGEFEAACRSSGEPSFRLLRDVSRMVIEDQVDRCMGRIGCVEQLEMFD